MASTVITPQSNIDARFVNVNGRNATVRVTGNGRAEINFRLRWNDNPSTNGDAIDSVTICNQDGSCFTINTPGENGDQTRSRQFVPGDYPIDFNGLIQDIRRENDQELCFRDNDGNDCNARLNITQIVQINPPPYTLSATLVASPNPKIGTFNGDNQVSLIWTSANADAGVSISGVGSVSGSPVVVNTGLQSNPCGGSSPAQRSYTITACSGPAFTYAGTICVSETTTVSVFNDLIPNDFSVPSTTTSGVSLGNLEPNTTYIMQIGTPTCFDVGVPFTSLSAGLDVSLNSVSWTSSIIINSGQAPFVRFTSQPFSTNPTGATNSRSYSFSIDGITKSFTATTRVPDVGELFDFGDSTVNYPFPDIDTVANTPQAYITSPTTVVMGDSGRPPDAEIAVEIKTNNPDVEIRVKPSGNATFGSWQGTRSI